MSAIAGMMKNPQPRKALRRVSSSKARKPATTQYCYGCKQDHPIEAMMYVGICKVRYNVQRAKDLRVT